MCSHLMACILCNLGTSRQSLDSWGEESYLAWHGDDRKRERRTGNRARWQREGRGKP